ncbi:hypothetical protein [Stenotrophobium rhamnosiphilum]|uniref:Uncharacterized protein n=1 Tax=Stenotrophobium rhamnosiphilum TaxID=2029166 RepID=A0A2T5MEG2_9GAMM|nr:hypothetical protein [Stenotrophobium rhamnosiphilum]PTU30956.1 hypothetical protein CJD38_11660 [Stenotrophobium rhamnosiphilum]
MTTNVPKEVIEAAKAAVIKELLATKWKGRENMVPYLVRTQDDYMKYRTALKVKEWTGATDAGIDAEALKNAVATSFAGGFTKRDGTASAGTGAVAQPKTVAGSGVWREYDQLKVINSIDGTIMTKAGAKKLGYIEEAKA